MLSIHSLLLTCLLAGVAPGEAEASGTSVSVMSFNIRYGTAQDGENIWRNRRAQVFDLIREGKYDFIGLQEALRFQIDEIRSAVPEFEEVGVGRDDGVEAGEYSAILYRSDRWRLDRGTTFWLSETPEVPGSKSWGNQITRIVTAGRFFEAATGRAVWVFNTHFDHQSQPSRERSAELLARRIADRTPRDPVIVTGDFNAGESNPAIVYLTAESSASPVRLVDAFRVLNPEAFEVGTFNAFRGESGGEKIDFVLVEKGTQVEDARILRDHRGGRFPSDHYPVTATVLLPPPTHP
jgi:endonuclease/exonuclease/phosphatase family metal-dependent hydrolase